MKATQCSVEECDHNARARGMCNMHYKRLMKRGTTDPYTSADRLADGLVRTANGCLEWTKCAPGFGYGQIYVDGKLIKTHRLAWTLANGPIPDGLLVLHHCDNPPCCQTEPTPGYPDGHLFLGTNGDNMRDMATKGRHVSSWAAKTHCPQGHPYDEANTYAASGGRRGCRMCRTIQRRIRYWREKSLMQ